MRKYFTTRYFRIPSPDIWNDDFCFIGIAPRGWYVKYGITLRKRDPDKIRPKNFVDNR